jgi:predicted NBD/HSP70 family sugar kinase
MKSVGMPYEWVRRTILGGSDRDTADGHRSFDASGDQMQFHLKLPKTSPTTRMGRDSLLSTLARLIASGDAASKADLARATGLSRSLIEPSVNTLIELGVVKRAGAKDSTGRGRPGEMLAMDPRSCLILVADCGFAHCTLAVLDLRQRLLASEQIEIPIGDDTDALLSYFADRLLGMVNELGLGDIPRRLVFGSPGFVDRVEGEVFPLARSRTSSWDGYPVATRMSELIGGPVQMEHDVALRAIGEAFTSPTTRGPLAYVKVSSGIGLAIVSASGELQLGADGFAGQISHVKVTDEEVTCACGNDGCLGAVASMMVIAESLDIDIAQAGWTESLLGLIQNQDARAIRAVKRSGEFVGQAVVDLIHFINPERVVIGGNLVRSSDHLLAGVRSIVYTRGLPFTTRSLIVSAPLLGGHSGIAGALGVALLSELSAQSFSDRLAGDNTAKPAAG